MYRTSALGLERSGNSTNWTKGEILPTFMTGKVYLVGAGPGDPELLTVRAHRILGEADVVLHDDLVGPAILALARSSAQVQNVGKRCGRRVTSQEEIHSRMVACAAEGRMVVRLKGGDPLVFGRAGEEMEALRRAGIEFEVVPGITAAFGAAALAQISLTDRRLASKLVFLSNHRCAENTSPDWKDVISSDATVVIYMPGTDYDGLAERMRVAGLGPETPCLLVSCANSLQQRIHRTTLEDLGEAPRFIAPVLLVIGAVAGTELREQDEAVFERVENRR
jgi:uroporphyrin-III C-methyltransferase